MSPAVMEGARAAGAVGYPEIVDPLRTRRVAEKMREELSELIRFESDDPRITLVDVTDVVVSPDMHRADVLVALPGGAAERAAALEGLTSARLYLRRQLMQRLDLFRMPELRFRADSEALSGAPIERLLRRARRGRAKGEQGQGDS
ncbi:MAG: 30S ribosome-binding factor RbfA [Candidatus Solibacter usitatus]|nr:30S ribosome-binding factor RbfA [Candidatus Solibacter usitatus]